MGIGGIVALCVFFCLLGAVAGAAATSYHLRKKIKENPPISADQIRELYTRLGKKPTEKQVRQLMAHITNKK